MNRGILLLALAAVGAVACGLPATAIAVEEDIPLHLIPKPEGAKTIDDVGANPTISGTDGVTIECATFHGTATFESTTTGKLELTFSTNCHDVQTGGVCTSSGQPEGTITTTELPFHLVTLPEKNGVNPPGVVVTANNGHIGTFVCKLGFLTATVEVKGNGVIGTMTAPKCGEESTEPTLDFNATAHGVQEHKTVAGTITEYTLTKDTVNAALDATARITLGTKARLECT